MANVLSHYTSFDSALHILLTGKVRFGRILNSNDKSEIDMLLNNPDKEKFQIFCCCGKPMSSLMWFAYAKNKYGVCIEFIIKKPYTKKKLLRKNNGMIHKSRFIEYCNIDEKTVHFTHHDELYAPHGVEWLKLYLPARSAMVLKMEKTRAKCGEKKSTTSKRSCAKKK